MHLSKHAFTISAVATIFAGSPLYAQATPDIEESIIRGSQITDLVRDEGRVTGSLQTSDGEIDGEGSIYVLTVNEIFFVGATLGAGYSENPQRTSNPQGGSFLADASAIIGVQTRVAETVDFGLRASISGVEYKDAPEVSSRSVVATMSAGMPISNTPLYVSASGFGGFNYNSDFENSTSFYGTSLAVSAGFPISQRTIIRPSIGATRQWSEIEENNSYSLAASVGAVHFVTSEFSVGANAAVRHVWFDDFYEDVTFVARNDWQYSGDVNARWSPNDWLGVTASLGYQKRDSAFFLSSYDGFEASLVVSARKRF